MNPRAVRQVLIAGGGTAGWMTAAALGRFLPDDVTVTLVESEAIGTVGVGEATLPTLADFNAMLGINEDDFLRACGGTFKLGIEFCDWGSIGERYFHPFGQFGLDRDGLPFHQHWARCRLAGDDRPLEAWSINAQAARAGTFMRPTTQDPRSPVSQIRHAYHLDAGRYAGFLRRYAQARGVRRVEGRIESVQQDPESGHIASITLDSGKCLTAELFIDCTGFRALLLGGALGVDFEDWTNLLPCDRAVTVPSAADESLPPYTRATARAAGWQWRIPLQHRTGNGFVFCERHLSEDEATAQLLASLQEPALADPASLRFRAGLRERFWTKNCVAIGLASGFMEPLESTSIHFIQAGIARLLGVFPTKDFDPAERAHYNAQMRTGFERVRDFLVLHYHLTRRDDAPLWNEVRHMDIPDSLTTHLQRFGRNGRHLTDSDSLFTAHNWSAVMTGQGLYPEAVDPLAEARPIADTQAFLADLAPVYQQAAGHMPPHRAFVERYCGPEAPPQVSNA